MHVRVRHCVALPLLLTLGGAAAAQTVWPSERTGNEAPRNDDAPMQTFVGIRHNASDGTVVGLSLTPPGHPDLQVQVEVVPPGYGALEHAQDRSAPNPLAPEPQQKLRNVHKLSLRYRF